jgi:hypothetical protein
MSLQKQKIKTAKAPYLSINTFFNVHKRFNLL